MAVVEAKLHDMINELDGEDYKMAVSFVQYLSEMRKKRKVKEKKAICADEGIEDIVDSLIGIIPDEFVSASAITDIYYIAQRTVKDKEAAKNLGISKTALSNWRKIYQINEGTPFQQEGWGILRVTRQRNLHV